jgi:hypothetical protein
MNVLRFLALLVVAAFCAFGFLASFEPVDGASAWRIGYGLGLLGCLLGGILLGRRIKGGR